MRPLSLIHTVAITGVGGNGATGFRLARVLAERGHRMLFCTPPGSIWAELGRREGMEISTEMHFRRTLNVSSLLHDIAALRRLARQRQADVVHVHRSPDYWRAALALGGAPRRAKLVRSRGLVNPVAGHMFNRWLHNRRTDLVICTASCTYDMYRSLPGFDGSKVRLMLDGVDVERFRPNAERAAIRTELGIPPGAPLVISVARFSTVKGHIHLVNAARAILEKCPDARFLVVAGRPAPGSPLEMEIRSRVAEMGMAGNFIFTVPGADVDVARLLRAADAFALCSLGSEGSSRGTLEAMATGLPVVATTVGCLPDVVVEDQTGFLVPPADSAALADRLTRLLTDASLRERMGRAARERAEAEFDERRVGERLEALYMETLDGVAGR